MQLMRRLFGSNDSAIYEIDGIKVAVEFPSFSKTAGFTGLRCALQSFPKMSVCTKRTVRPLS